jgi:hypothetical protein
MDHCDPYYVKMSGGDQGVGMQWQNGHVHEDVQQEKDSYQGKLGYALVGKKKEFLEKEKSKVGH